jgi:hypothetical protein
MSPIFYALLLGAIVLLFCLNLLALLNYQRKQIAYYRDRTDNLCLQLAQAIQDREHLNAKVEAQRETIVKHAKSLGLKIVPVLLVALLAASSIAQEVSPPPNDGGRCYMTVITHAAPQPHELQLLDNLARDPNLVAIRNQMHFVALRDTDVAYRDRFAHAIPPSQLPAIWIARPDGGVLYKATGERIPTAAADLFDEMLHYCSLDPQSTAQDSQLSRPIAGPQDCPDGRCPVPTDTNLPWLATPSAPIPLPDSVELLRDRTPAKNAIAVVLWIVGGIVALCVLGVAGVVFLAVIYLAAKVILRI